MQHTVFVRFFRCAWVGHRCLDSFVPPFLRRDYGPNHESAESPHEVPLGTHRVIVIFSKPAVVDRICLVHRG